MSRNRGVVLVTLGKAQGPESRNRDNGGRGDNSIIPVERESALTEMMELKRWS